MPLVGLQGVIVVFPEYTHTFFIIHMKRASYPIEYTYMTMVCVYANEDQCLSWEPFSWDLLCIFGIFIMQRDTYQIFVKKTY